MVFGGLDAVWHSCEYAKAIESRLQARHSTYRHVLYEWPEAGHDNAFDPLSDRPPRYERKPAGSLVDAVDPRVRLFLLAEFPTMPATVIAERIGWTHSLPILKDRVRELRPPFLGVDPADRFSYDPARSHSAPCGSRRSASRSVAAAADPAGAGDDDRLLPHHWRGDDPVTQGGRHPGRAVGAAQRLGTMPTDARMGSGVRDRWQREADRRGRRLRRDARVRIKLAPARDPDFKGLIERRTSSSRDVKPFCPPVSNVQGLTTVGPRRLDVADVIEYPEIPTASVSLRMKSCFPMGPQTPPTPPPTRRRVDQDGLGAAAGSSGGGSSTG